MSSYNGAAPVRAVLTTARGEIEVALHGSEAPLGAEHFVTLVETGAIVGTEFGRVVPNFVAQQRPIRGAALLRDEVSRLGLTRGNVSWASAGLDTGRPGYTFGSTPQPHNEGDFTALGRVVARYGGRRSPRARRCNRRGEDGEVKKMAGLKPRPTVGSDHGLTPLDF